MITDKIGIIGYGTCSALGGQDSEIWQNYLKASSLISFSDATQTYQSSIPNSLETTIQSLRKEQKYYEQLDRTVLLSIFATRQALKNTDWKGDSNVGINIGSSRGASQVFEQKHQHFLQHKNLKREVLTSPLTTLGNISSWTAKDAAIEGLAFSHSLTCSTAFHSIINGVAWLQSGLLDKMIVGGSEAPLTPFTLAQMQALRIYSNSQNRDFPCRAMDLEKKENTMVLGEGAAVFCIEKNPKVAIAYIEGIGFATEKMEHPTSISKDGNCLRRSMQMALQNEHLSNVDVIITHSPGTKRGDQAEYTAIQSIFGDNIPPITCNKWKIGHTLGASGALSLEMGLLMILHDHFIPIPYLANSKIREQKIPRKIQTILINTVGFGGTAVSVLIKNKGCN